MSTIVSESTSLVSETLPAVPCATWCADGKGHVDAWHPDDQYCLSGSVGGEFPVSLYRLAELADGTRVRETVAVQISRDAHSTLSKVSIRRGDDFLLDLTRDEARELAARLSAAVMADEQSERDRERNAFEIGRDAERLGLMNRD